MQFKGFVSLLEKNMSGWHEGGKAWGGWRFLSSGQAALRRLEVTVSCPACPLKELWRQELCGPWNIFSTRANWYLASSLTSSLARPTFVFSTNLLPESSVLDSLSHRRSAHAINSAYDPLPIPLHLVNYCSFLWFQLKSHLLRPAFSDFPN